MFTHNVYQAPGGVEDIGDVRQPTFGATWQITTPDFNEPFFAFMCFLHDIHIVSRDIKYNEISRTLSYMLQINGLEHG